jgi:hypothetical protein
LAEELRNALHADIQLSAERNHIDSRIIMSQPGSDAMVYYTEKLLVIKQKQLQLNSGVIDTIKGGLEEKFSRDDSDIVGVAGFPDDSPELVITDMPDRMKAVLLDKFKAKDHITVEEFFSVVYAQPWHAEEAVLDVRFEEKISEYSLSVDTMNTEAKLLDGIIEDLKDKIALTKSQVRC